MSEGRVREIGSASDLRHGAANRWRIFRLGLVGLWLMCAGAAVVLHERSATLAEFYAAVAAGDVNSVEIAGYALPPGSGGYTTRVLQWREGWSQRTATIVEVSGGSAGPEAGEVTTDDVAQVLARSGADVEVVSTSDLPARVELAGYLVPDWLGVVAVLICLAVLFLLVNGPEPWRATRWAWFWLAGTPGLSLLFLLWSGPTPGIRPPRDVYRRWSGGPAFLVSLVLSGALVAAAG